MILGREPTREEIDSFLVANSDYAKENGPRKMRDLDPFGFNLHNRPNAPYNYQDAIDEIKEITGRTPNEDEINDWLYEMNEPFSHDQFQLDIGLPGYSEIYHEADH